MAIAGYKHIASNSAGGGDGSSWALAGASAAYTLAEWKVFLEEAVVAGYVMFVKDGTYSMIAAINCSARNGTATSPIVIVGVMATTTNVGAAITYADWSRDVADRPFFDLTTFQFRGGDYYHLINVDCQGAAAPAVQIGTFGQLVNCKFDQNYVSPSSRYALQTDASARISWSEFLSTNARGVVFGGETTVAYCYFHDITDTTFGSAFILSAGSHIVGCIFDNIGYGSILYASNTGGSVVGCTFYNTGRAVDSVAGYGFLCINNICEGATVAGFTWTLQTDNNLFWGNHFHDNAADTVNVDTTTVFQDYEATSGDPLFTAAGSDFSLLEGSPCRSTAEDTMLGVGATVRNGNKGAYQGRTGSPTFSAAAWVHDSQDPYGWDEEYTPAFDEEERNTDPGVANVRTQAGTYKIANVTKTPTAANIDYPSVGNVLNDDTVDGSAGTFANVSTADVRLNTQWGEDGTEFTGALSTCYIKSISPATDNVAGGKSITIRCAGAGATQGVGFVKFDTTAGTIRSWSDTEIQAYAPAHAAGSVGVTLQNNSGANDTWATAFTYVSASTAGLDRKAIVDALHDLFVADTDILYGSGKYLTSISVKDTDFARAAIDVNTPYKMYLKATAIDPVEVRAQNTTYAITVRYRVEGLAIDPDSAQQNLDNIDERLNQLVNDQMWRGMNLSEYYTNTLAQVINMEWMGSECEVAQEGGTSRVHSEGSIVITVNRQT